MYKSVGCDLKNFEILFLLKRYFASAFFFLVFQTFAQPTAPGGIALALKKLNTNGSVLYIAAHPDDENTRLIGWMSNEKCLRTGYLSITRGDGGQNLIGKEQGDHLGMIRTQELIAARRTDGGEQMFTRAIDFGFSKNPEETFAIWDKDSILKDVVYAIRKFRPDVVVCRFGTDGSGGHGHHTASAILAEEAFDLAGDSMKFPSLNPLVKPWKPKLLAWNFWVERSKMTGKIARMEVGGYNKLLGKSYGEIASESRSMHKSQGFGVARSRGETFEYFKILKGDCDTNNLFSGVDFNWKRMEGGPAVGKLTQEAERKFDFRNPEGIVPILVQAYKAADNLKDSYWRQLKKKQIANLIKSCCGLYAEASAQDYFTTPGSKLKINLTLINRSRQLINLRRISIAGLYDTSFTTPLKFNNLLKTSTWISIPVNQPTSNPYWLNQTPLTKGLVQISNPAMIGQPESDPAFEAAFDLTFGDVSIPVSVPVEYKWVEPSDGEKYRSLEILPPVTANLEEKAFVFPDLSPKTVQIKVVAQQNSISGKLKVQVPPSWKIEPEEQNFSFAKKEEEQIFEVKITPVLGATIGKLAVHLTVNQEIYSQSLIRISYPHIPIQTLLYPAEAKLVLVDLKKTGLNIGYIPGAGDAVAESLRQVGYTVTELTDDQLVNGNLNQFNAIVTGIRVYNINDRMKVYYPRLMAYVQQGGNLILQYNTNNWISSLKGSMGPFPFTISRERVTKEEAPVSFVLPKHPVINSPNKLTNNDFDGWVQERGIYFASDFGPEYEAPLSMQDPGEKEQTGSLIVAPYGKGNFVYTGLALFRQLPAGIPGAYRLMANLLGLGKH